MHLTEGCMAKLIVCRRGVINVILNAVLACVVLYVPFVYCMALSPVANARDVINVRAETAVITISIGVRNSYLAPVSENALLGSVTISCVSGCGPDGDAQIYYKLTNALGMGECSEGGEQRVNWLENGSSVFSIQASPPAIGECRTASGQPGGEWSELFDTTPAIIPIVASMKGDTPGRYPLIVQAGLYVP